MTWLLRVLVPRPGRDSRSRTQTLRPRRAMARAAARPTTPAPMMTVSMRVVSMVYSENGTIQSLRVPVTGQYRGR